MCGHLLTRVLVQLYRRATCRAIERCRRCCALHQEQQLQAFDTLLSIGIKDRVH